MSDKQTSRRRFIVAALTFSTVATAVPGFSWLRSSAAWASSDNETDRSTMARFARLLFPHDEIPDSVYADVIDNVFAALASDPATEDLLASAEDALNAHSDTPWVDLDEDEQIVAINAVQDAAFFPAILGAVRGVFYYDPAVWQYLDYPGSSKQHGGYKHRGFDDIDWLPGEA